MNPASTITRPSPNTPIPLDDALERVLGAFDAEPTPWPDGGLQSREDFRQIAQPGFPPEPWLIRRITVEVNSSRHELPYRVIQMPTLEIHDNRRARLPAALGRASESGSDARTAPAIG
jgi:hypothetical protein